MIKFKTLKFAWPILSVFAFAILISIVMSVFLITLQLMVIKLINFNQLPKEYYEYFISCIVITATLSGLALGLCSCTEDKERKKELRLSGELLLQSSIYLIITVVFSYALSLLNNSSLSKNLTLPIRIFFYITATVLTARATLKTTLAIEDLLGAQHRAIKLGNNLVKTVELILKTKVKIKKAEQKA